MFGVAVLVPGRYRELNVPDRAIPIVSSDSDIIQRSRDTPAAFSDLYDRYAAIIHRFAARRVGGNAADDIMSETFLVAFERRFTFLTDQDDAKPWLFGIATTLMKKHVRLEARAWKGLAAASSAEVHHDATEAAGSRIDAARSLRRLGYAMKRMPAGDRDALLLYAWADLDYDGVAAALGVPIGTVRSRLNRVRRKLRAASELGIALTLEVEDGRVDPAAQSAQ